MAKSAEVNGLRIAVLGYKTSRYVYVGTATTRRFYGASYPGYTLAKVTICIENTVDIPMWFSVAFELLTEEGIKVGAADLSQLQIIRDENVTKDVESEAIPFNPLTTQGELTQKMRYVIGDILFQVPEKCRPTQIRATVRVGLFKEKTVILDLEE